MAAPDRKIALLGQNVVTGIDYIYVASNQTTLDVYFLLDPLGITVPLNTLTPEQILIYNSAINEPAQEVEIASISWIVVGTENVLRVETVEPGDFTLYKFGIDDGRVDRVFNNLVLNFKANCPSDLDCKTPDHECADVETVDFPIDYQARDFDSFRLALQDFASLRYPNWTDRLEADSGIMLMEMMSALGDEMSYYQDRVGREAHLETATQRRSIRRHARLLDYPVHDGLGASTWLDVTVADGFPSGDITAGTQVWAMSDSETQIQFEIGQNLQEIIDQDSYRVFLERNEFQPHSWDEDDVCLAAGSTELYISGHHETTLRPGGGFDVEWIIIKTLPEPGIPGKTHLVKLDTVTDDDDPVLLSPITRLTWSEDYATPYEMDLAQLVVRGNIVPVIAGETFTERFIIGEDPDPVAMSDPFYGTPIRAVERSGPSDVPVYLYSLTDSDEDNLVWEGEEPLLATPAISIRPVTFTSPDWLSTPNSDWNFRTSLLGSPSSLPQDKDYSLDDGLWKRVVGYQRPQGMVIHYDYATDQGKTIRFGDGEFGLIPAEGTIFQVDYRLGNGTVGNVEAEAIDQFDTDDTALDFIDSISNPIAASNGQDEESVSDIKRDAPEAFRAVTYRAVRSEDYAEAAERLDWVQKAGAEFRWTGSWLTGFVTPDPLDSVAVTETQEKELTHQIERFRQAGREVYNSEPIYANIDLELEICLQPDAFASEVKGNIMIALFGKSGPRPQTGYFHPDLFTFGTPLRRSNLEAAIQDVPGVKAVEQIKIRRRGWFDWRIFNNYEYQPGANVIIRLSNNLLFPEQGTLKIFTHGGA